MEAAKCVVTTLYHSLPLCPSGEGPTSRTTLALSHTHTLTCACTPRRRALEHSLRLVLPPKQDEYAVMQRGRDCHPVGMTGRCRAGGGAASGRGARIARRRWLWRVTGKTIKYGGKVSGSGRVRFAKGRRGEIDAKL